MQTPISFALEILLDCDTIEKAHKMARRYIKVLEACGNQAIRPAGNFSGPASIAQAPSTQRLLEQHASAQPAAQPISAPLLARAPPGAEVNNGDGTKGKRKW